MQLRRHATGLASLVGLLLSSACATEASLPEGPDAEPPSVEAKRPADGFHSTGWCPDGAACGSVGHWDEPIQIAPGWGGDYPTRGTLLATGDVFMWSKTKAYLFDPTTSAVEEVPGPVDTVGAQISMGGGAHALLPDGRLLIVGGETISKSPGAHDKAFIFDPTGLRQVESVADIPGGPRKGATATIMPNGVVVVIGGFGGQGSALREVVSFDPSTDDWTILGNLEAKLMSPFVRAISNSEIVVVDDASFVLNLDDMGVTELPLAQQSHAGGSAVLMPRSGSNIVGIIGGGDPSLPANKFETLSMIAEEASWEPGPPLAIGRQRPKTVILPDGSLLVVGGRGVRAAEILRPDVNAEWHIVASQQFARGTGSFAMLLPDGRVLSGGGGSGSKGDPAPGAYLEIYSPSYLYDRPLPVLLDAPSTIHRDSAFHLEFELHETVCEDRPGIADVLLVGPGASADGFDSAQSSTPMTISLPWSKCSGGTGAFGGVWVTVPSSAAKLPVGDYMMFGVDETGLPSRGSFVRLEE